MNPQDALSQTATFTAQQAQHYGDGDITKAPFLVLGAVLVAQQAVCCSLVAVEDTIPSQAGATELILRAANPKHLPAPYTLPFDHDARQAFDHLVLKRNAFMHPRGHNWTITDTDLAVGLSVVCRILDHLLMTQPVHSGMLAETPLAIIERAVADMRALAEFLG